MKQDDLQPVDGYEIAGARAFVRRADGVVLTADGSAENRHWLAARFGAPVLVVGQAALRAALLARQGEALLEDAILGLQKRNPALSAHIVCTPPQKWIFASLMLAVIVTLWCAPVVSLHWIANGLSLVFFAGALFRAWLAWQGAEAPVPPPPAANDCSLPVYTVMVPLYREAQVVPALVAALQALDYPKDRLDIKLVVEADDAQTRDACAATGFDVIAVPPSLPRTKPKAANYALAFARGDYVVIYDAEDRPEPDQLLKAVGAFRHGPRRIACLQARLNFYNANQNWLTRMFALDYALWFDVLLPGLDRMQVPMPLGGTSNHFRTGILREIGGWDAFNVTEDADIGIRLSQLGHGVAMLDSTTFEECPVQWQGWLRQRSRWLKGYMQTWLVHMRDPVALARRTGLKGLLSLQLFLGGGVLFALANPLLWAMLIAALLHRGAMAALFPGTSLLASNILLTWLAMIGPRRRGWNELSPYGVTVVFYWAMVSVAGYRGLWQLMTKPFYWEKTTHGLAKTCRSPGP